tara:strand:+ start:1763 stop:2494 length:732 start_codon:yes stop_codon:yes gene_type:complete
MDYEKLCKLSFSQLKSIANELKITSCRSKDKLLDEIIIFFTEYEAYKSRTEKYNKIRTLGNKGKEGITFLVRKKNGMEYAMKTFNKRKSSDRIKKEAYLQTKAAELNIAPRVIEVDTISNYIVMEKMDKHLLEIIKKESILTKCQQKQIIKIYKKLDEANVFHADANLLNYMLLGRQIYIIDFGMAKEITNDLIKKLGTNTPNLSIMTLGFILKLKEMSCPFESYEYMINFLTEEQINQFKLR